MSGSKPAPLNSVRPTNNSRVGTNDFMIQGLGPSPEGGDVHLSFQVDGDGNITDSHVTARIKGGKSINTKE